MTTPPTSPAGELLWAQPQTAQPAVELRPFITAYSAFEAALPPGEEIHAQVIPPGVPVITLLLSGHIRITDGPAAGQTAPPAAFTGQLTRSGGTACGGHLHTFMVHFSPAGAHDLLGIDMKPLQNTTVELSAAAGAGTEAYLQAIQKAPDFVTRCHLTDAFFEDVRQRSGQAPGLGAAAAQLLMQHAGKLEVENLAQRLGISARTLLRRFTHEVGVSPKSFARLMRFRAAHNYLQAPNATWADAVLKFGYTDQSHLIRDYRDFAGETPRQYDPEARVLDRSATVTKKPEADAR
ncbi:AraC family transcriptional regulator [Hymenobacter koreensis]|uniref:HTH araC/xylS-type domain-containing protein n=1 Tax=Hymenobacter koreensis TaxID=1084523 RepID=A0ABP8IUJ1_9BACT